MKAPAIKKNKTIALHEKPLSGFPKQPVILQVVPNIKGGGVEAGTLEVAKAIRNAGGKAIIAANIKNAELANQEKEIEFVRLPLDTKNPLKLLTNISKLKNLIKEKNVDIVHARSRAPAWSAYFACKALNVQFITTHHAAYSSKTIFKNFYNSIMVRGHNVIATSEFIYKHIENSYSNKKWFDKSKIRLINRGIDLSVFDPALTLDSKSKAMKESWGFSPNTKIILMPGRISNRKGQDVIIKALHLSQRKDTAVILIGSASGHERYKKRLLKYASSLGLRERVKWISHTHEMTTAYNCSTIVVSASRLPEGFGRTLAEAQAMEKPIISSDHGAAREIIEENVTGWFFSANDGLELAQTIDKVLEMPQTMLNKIGKEGRKRVELLFTSEQMCSKTVQLYKEILQNQNAS